MVCIGTRSRIGPQGRRRYSRTGTNNTRARTLPGSPSGDDKRASSWASGSRRRPASTPQKSKDSLIHCVGAFHDEEVSGIG